MDSFIGEVDDSDTGDSVSKEKEIIINKISWIMFEVHTLHVHKLYIIIIIIMQASL